jgi:hypothetical protein
MTHHEIAIFLGGLGLGVAISWLLEAILVGRGVISTYLAPVAFLSPLIVAFILRK